MPSNAIPAVPNREEIRAAVKENFPGVRIVHRKTLSGDELAGYLNLSNRGELRELIEKPSISGHLQTLLKEHRVSFQIIDHKSRD